MAFLRYHETMTGYNPNRNPAGTEGGVGGQFAAGDSVRDDAGQVDLGLEPATDFGALTGNRRYSELDKAERLDAIKADLQASIDEIVSSGKLGDYLDAMSRSRIGKWSFNNQLLAHMQLSGVREELDADDPHKDSPPMLMSGGAWKREYGAFPKKGSKAIWILAPVTRTIEEDDGKGGTEKRVIITGFRPQAEFDISQVQGDDLPDVNFYSGMTVPAGEAPPGAYTGLKDRIEKTGYAYSEGKVGGSDEDVAKGTTTLGYTDPRTKKVVVDERCTPAQKVSVMAHELAHIKHGHVGKDGEDPTEALAEYRQHRGRMETEAEATAYMTVRALGMEHEQSGSFSATYIAGWSKGDGEVVAKSLNSSTKVFNDIMDGDWPESD